MPDRCLIDPAAARELPQGSKERGMARLALRQWWHIVLDPCPSLTRVFPPDGLAVLDPFLHNAWDARLSMTWPLHGHLLSWLEKNHPDRLSPESVIELLAACAARWANTDQTAAAGILIARGAVATAAWKCARADEEHRVVEVRLPSNAPHAASYCLLSTHEYPASPAWRDLPR